MHYIFTFFSMSCFILGYSPNVKLGNFDVWIKYTASQGEGAANLHAFDIFDRITSWILCSGSHCCCYWKLWNLKPLTRLYMSFREASGIILGHVSMHLVSCQLVTHGTCSTVLYTSSLLNQKSTFTVSLIENNHNCVLGRYFRNSRKQTTWVFMVFRKLEREEVVKNALVTVEETARLTALMSLSEMSCIHVHQWVISGLRYIF